MITGKRKIRIPLKTILTLLSLSALIVRIVDPIYFYEFKNRFENNLIAVHKGSPQCAYGTADSDESFFLFTSILGKNYCTVELDNSLTNIRTNADPRFTINKESPSINTYSMMGVRGGAKRTFVLFSGKKKQNPGDIIAYNDIEMPSNSSKYKSIDLSNKNYNLESIDIPRILPSEQLLVLTAYELEKDRLFVMLTMLFGFLVFLITLIIFWNAYEFIIPNKQTL